MIRITHIRDNNVFQQHVCRRRDMANDSNRSINQSLFDYSDYSIFL